MKASSAVCYEPESVTMAQVYTPALAYMTAAQALATLFEVARALQQVVYFEVRGCSEESDYFEWMGYSESMDCSEEKETIQTQNRPIGVYPGATRRPNLHLTPWVFDQNRDH